MIRNFFDLTLVYNPAAAFSIFSGLDPSLREPLLLAIPILTLLGIIVFFYKLPQAQTINICALSMIIGGAVGNIADRLRFGYVIDFLHFHIAYQYNFPAFNVADSAITGCVIFLLLQMYLDMRKRKPTGHQT